MAVNDKKVLTSGGSGGIINIEIDKFVPCLEDAKTGEVYQTEVAKLSRSDLKKYNIYNGWFDNWSERPDDEEVFGVFVKGEKEPEGLISMRYENGGTYIASVSTAPHNNKTIVGNEYKYVGVGGHLFAVAIEQSIKNGGYGVIYRFANNYKVLEHYIDKFKATHIPLVHEYQFIIEGQASEEILNFYNYERR